jgi:WD40 repeat protein
MFTYEHKAVFRGHRDSINCLAMDGNILFSGSDDKTIRLWDTVNPQFLTLIEAHEHGVKDLLVIDDSGYLVSCATEAIHVWDYPKKLLVTVTLLPHIFRNSKNQKH